MNTESWSMSSQTMSDQFHVIRINEPFIGSLCNKFTDDLPNMLNTMSWMNIYWIRSSFSPIYANQIDIVLAILKTSCVSKMKARLLIICNDSFEQLLRIYIENNLFLLSV